MGGIWRRLIGGKVVAAGLDVLTKAERVENSVQALARLADQDPEVKAGIDDFRRTWRDLQAAVRALGKAIGVG